MKAAVVIFGREPVPGRVKTRLAAGIGETAAARVYAELLAWTVETAAATGVPVVLSLADPPSRAWRPPAAAVEVQPPGDLGRRMLATFQRRFSEGFERALIIGSDCPWVTPGRLAVGLSELDRAGVVLGPAGDGGYWLIGQRAPQVDCFTGVPWSSARTLDATRRRLEELGLGWAEVDRLEDVDTEEDLERALLRPGLDPGLRSRLWRARAGKRRNRG